MAHLFDENKGKVDFEEELDFESRFNAAYTNKRVLLWTNPNPTSSTFDTQTLSLDLSNYDYVEIEHQSKQYVGGWKYVYKIDKFRVESSGYLQTIMHEGDNISTPGIPGDIDTRWVTVNADSIVFGKGYTKHMEPASYDLSPAAATPLKIYGIKS